MLSLSLEKATTGDRQTVSLNLFFKSLKVHLIFLVFSCQAGAGKNQEADLQSPARLEQDLLSLIPDKIEIPKNIETKTADQIKAVFSPLKNQNKTKSANLWSLSYREALLLEKKDTESFCRIMKGLSETSRFPLKDLALVKSYAICPFDEPVFFDSKAAPSWLGLDLAQAFYKRRKLFESTEEALKAAVYLAKNSPYKELRISYLKHALAFLEEKERSLQKTEFDSSAQNFKKPQDAEGEGLITKQELQKLLYKESPSLDPQPKRKNYLLIAEDFRERRKFQPAIQYYIKVLNLPQFSFEEKNASFKGLDKIYRVQRSRERKIRNSKQWSVWLLRENTPKSLKSYYKKKLEIARQKWNNDKNQEAIVLLTELLRDKKASLIKNQALLLRGAVYAQEKREDLSLKDWDKAVANLLSKKQSQKNSTVLAKVLWRRAWLYRKRKNYKKALESFILLKRLEDKPYTHHRALFWTGRTYEDLGSCFSSRRFFRRLAKKDIYGYYGLLASYKLGQKKVYQTKKFPLFEIKPLIYWLNLFEEKEILSRLLEKEIHQNFPDKSSSLEEWLRVIWLWSQSEKHLEIFRSFQEMSPEVQKELIEKHVQLLFPLNFYKEAQQAGGKRALSSSLILSVIRQESAFNPRARSPADAFGLMQLIPSTARQTARDNKIVYRNYKDLYRPVKNIQIGATYLSHLFKKYDGDFILALSAYNAGRTPVKRWKKELDFWTALEFIENIPYEETRTYVRLIIRNFIFYHHLLEKENQIPNQLEALFKEEDLKC